VIFILKQKFLILFFGEFRMSRSRSRSPEEKFKNQIYVGYLPNHATMDDVEDFFKGYGPIKTINLKPGYGKGSNFKSRIKFLN